MRLRTLRDRVRYVGARVVQDFPPGAGNAHGLRDLGGRVGGEATLDVDYEERGARHLSRSSLVNVG